MVIDVKLYGEGNDQLAAVFPHERYLAAAGAPASVLQLTPTQKRKVRSALTRFFSLAEQNALKTHYSQNRPFDPSVDPVTGFVGDCSSYVTQAFEWVRRTTGIRVHDPNGVVEFDGWGYTGTTLSTNHRYVVPEGRTYFVGDIAICGTFWDTVHEFICKKGGSAETSLWSSHGSESGPRQENLHYRPDVFVVVRPISLH